MKVYTDSEAGENISTVLEHARSEGAVRIQRGDGQSFLIRPENPASSPLDVPGVDLGLSADEIVAFIREGRRDPTALS